MSIAHPPLVLLVNDKPENLFTLLLACSVQRKPCELVAFPNGHALTRFLKSIIDLPELVLVDCQLPSKQKHIIKIVRTLAATTTIVLFSRTPNNQIIVYDHIAKTVLTAKPNNFLSWCDLLYELFRL